MSHPSERLLSIAYVTGNGKIPSYNANSVGVMKLCGHLKRLGVDVRLVLPYARRHVIQTVGDIWSFYGVGRFPVYRLPSILDNRIFFALAGLYAFLTRVEHVHTRNIHMACIAAALRKPVVFESHNYVKAARSSLFPVLVRYLRSPERRVGLVVTTQSSALAYIEAGVPPSRVSVVPNGVELENFLSQPGKAELRRSLGIPPDKLVACYSGNLYEGRGIEDIIDCAAIRPDVVFLLVGGRPSDVERYRLTLESRCLKNVMLTGHVIQDQVPMYLLAADVLLLTNTSQSNPLSMKYVSPMKMFDYLAAGRPMVVQDFPVLREVLADKVNSLLVEPGNGQALAEAIDLLAAEPALAESIGNRARADAERYSWARRAEHILEAHIRLGAITPESGRN